MNNALFIVGPTATGKTKLALQISKVIPSVLISADSRQVYKGMDIGTGKDRPDNAKIELLDVVSPNEEWSVAHFVKQARILMERAWSENKLPIFVGGTGLYLQTLIENDETIAVPINEELRKNTEHKTVSELQEKLSSLDQDRLHAMNNSDRNNPRRLVRAIEIAAYRQTHAQQKQSKHFLDDTLWIGLTLPPTALKENIHARVIERVEQGMENEVKKLIHDYPTWNFPSFSATGYKEYRDFLEGKLNKNEMINQWALRELQYAKRQITWFKKRKQIVWFPADNPKLFSLVEKQVQSWYHENHATN